ncbi:hypothetical protein [Micromonospora sp. NBC_01813]|uniref:hypothetical protein n=1 Tax=Micromonospora sp. NBC_01813 TaxID=2975988 RepID=UPI003FA396CF
MSSHAVSSQAGSGDGRFVIHLPIVARDLRAAINVAVALARSLAFVPQLDIGETTVSGEDLQSVHHRVFCDRALPRSRRCGARHGHDGPCDSESGSG